MNKQKQIEEMAEIALKNTLSYTCAKQIAMNFYNAGYRKIPENAVVLTKEEYERLLKIEKDFNTVHYCFVEKSRVEEVRKETAEKFAEMVSKAFMSVNCIDIDEWNWCQRKIDEICKEISEGKSNG